MSFVTAVPKMYPPYIAKQFKKESAFVVIAFGGCKGGMGAAGETFRLYGANLPLKTTFGYDAMGLNAGLLSNTGQIA